MPGNVSGPTNNRPSTRAGGLGIRGDGNPLGVRDNVNFITTPGVRPSVSDDPGNDRVNVSWEIDAEVLLGEVTAVDVTTPGTVTPISSPIFTRAHITKILVIITNFAGTVTTQPIISAGTDVAGTNPNDDIADLQLLDSGMNAVDLVQGLTLLNPRPTIDQTPPTDVVRVVIDTAATGTGLTYQVTIQVYGVVVTP